MQIRPRRNRKSAAIRDLVQENHLSVNDLLYPMFLMRDVNANQPIKSMPGQSRLGIEPLSQKMEACLKLGIKAFAIFPVIEDYFKDSYGSYSYASDNYYLETLSTLKKRFPEACLMTDVALDPYSSDGHDGIVVEGEIVNDPTLEVLAKMSIAQAQAGADIIGPSDMMDGRVGFIRDALDEAGFQNVSIMAYTAKYASAFYGPFRDALDSTPRFGDKKTYQMNPANSREALLEAQLDEIEGADMLMVKPALAYLDIISLLKQNSVLPISAYNVSGEYAMLHAAAQNGWLDLEKTMMESLLSIKRAGADIILSYFAPEAAAVLTR